MKIKDVMSMTLHIHHEKDMDELYLLLPALLRNIISDEIQPNQYFLITSYAQGTVPDTVSDPKV